MESNFVDYVKIVCRSGKGGRGSMHMHRAKYAPNGGPDGGNGGRGGNRGGNRNGGSRGGNRGGYNKKPYNRGGNGGSRSNSGNASGTTLKNNDFFGTFLGNSGNKD